MRLVLGVFLYIIVVFGLPLAVFVVMNGIDGYMMFLKLLLFLLAIVIAVVGIPIVVYKIVENFF